MFMKEEYLCIGVRYTHVKHATGRVVPSQTNLKFWILLMGIPESLEVYLQQLIVILNDI